MSLYRFLDRANLRERELFLVIGDSGVGKSTVTSYLAGIPLKRITDEFGFELIESAEADSYIGHDIASKTLIPNIIASRLEDYPFIFADCAGFKDNRPLETEIVGAVTTQHVTQEATIIGIIVVLSFRAIEEHLSTSLIKTVRHLNNLLPALASGPNALLFVVNRCPDNATLADVTARLAAIRQNTPVPELSTFIDTVQRAKLALCFPLKPEFRQPILDDIAQLEPLPDDYPVQVSLKEEHQRQVGRFIDQGSPSLSRDYANSCLTSVRWFATELRALTIWLGIISLQPHWRRLKNKSSHTSGSQKRLRHIWKHFPLQVRSPKGVYKIS